MRLLAPDSDADVYAISCQLGLTKIGVAADAKERRRAMQVGSPVPLELAGCYHFRSSQDAYAIAADVQRQLADRRERGGWYRVTPAEVRQAIGTRSAQQAPRAAAEARQAAPAAAAQAERLRAERVLQRRRSRARARREKLRALARLLAAGLTQRAAGKELGVDERTIRRWTKLPGFETELAKARSRHERELERVKRRQQTRRDSNARRRLARRHPARYRELNNPAMRPERPAQPAAEPHRQPAATRDRSRPERGRILNISGPNLGSSQTDYAAWLDRRDARVPLTRADLHSRADLAPAGVVAAGGGMQAVIEATGLRTLENVLRGIDPAILERARQNDATRPPAPES